MEMPAEVGVVRGGKEPGQQEKHKGQHKGGQAPHRGSGARHQVVGHIPQPGQQPVRQGQNDVLHPLGQVAQPPLHILGQLLIGALKGVPHLVPVVDEGGDLPPQPQNDGGNDASQGCHQNQNKHNGPRLPGHAKPPLEKAEEGFHQPGKQEGQQERHHISQQRRAKDKHHQQQAHKNGPANGQTDPQLLPPGAGKGLGRIISIHTGTYRPFFGWTVPRNRQPTMENLGK